ncbi:MULTISPECIES: fimbrial protein [Pseudomonas]|jgi:P pilus assembly protein, pilin FimA|uniref:fimbrial protein n=1 Tax=Pseudomonas TaxID=286 RepID=UPI0020A017BC|nr:MULTISPECIES: fimbrial protein [Pseudomonas]MCP1480360.1 type 1 fimbria pilin [Pseudomonas chlororaphis]MCP1593288.1 type 1 fimbria pilin [Pseudomonas chlororaphis]WPO50164.1 fimbrial protein [Pseudomonas sp. S1Bt23]
MRKLIFGVVAAAGFFVAVDVFAACTWSGATPTPIKNIPVPAQIILKAVPIGGELAKYSENLWPLDMSKCPGATEFSMSLETALLPTSQSNVFDSGVKGIGVKFTVVRGMNNFTSGVPFSDVMKEGWHPYLPHIMNVTFVRTGRDVASGNVSLNFRSVWRHVEHTLTVQSQGTTQLVNDIFFAGCESVGAAVNVPMGKQTIDNLKKGSVKEVPFNFDVRCEGLKPDTKVPVKVYFEGNSQADGLLKLSNLGQAGVASGVGISLVNDKGVKLPFDISRSIALDWNREIAEGSIYRFSGSAKYAPTGGEIKPGKGDATMSFVLNYN